MREGYHQVHHLRSGATRLKVLDFIVTYCQMNGYSPTIREIRDGVGLKSNGNVQQHLDRLFDAGLIRHNPNQIRSIVPAS